MRNARVADSDPLAYLKRAANGWESARATEASFGFTRFATLAEALAGTATAIAIDPVRLRAAARRLETVRLTTPGAGTWTVPANIYQIELHVTGGGGGGGGAQNAQGYPGAGGGGGSGATLMHSMSVEPGQVIPFTVGAGGAAGTPSANGGNGGASVFATSLVAGGGQGGITGAGSTTAGGVATGGDIIVDGNDGGTSTLMPSGQTKGGDGARSQFGSGGAASATGNGNVAKGYGSGGGGAGGGGHSNTGANGGAGAPGLIIIRY